MCTCLKAFPAIAGATGIGQIAIEASEVGIGLAPLSLLHRPTAVRESLRRIEPLGFEPVRFKITISGVFVCGHDRNVHFPCDGNARGCCSAASVNAKKGDYILRRRQQQHQDVKARGFTVGSVSHKHPQLHQKEGGGQCALSRVTRYHTHMLASPFWHADSGTLCWSRLTSKNTFLGRQVILWW